MATLPPYDYTRARPTQPYDYSQPYPLPPEMQRFNVEEPAPVEAPPPEVTEPEMTYPARDALLEYAKQVPQYEQPGWFNRVVAGAAGGSEGWFKGGGAGVQAAQNTLMTPYRQAVERYKVGLQPLETAARVETAGAGIGARYAALGLGKDRLAETVRSHKANEAIKGKTKESVAYTGQYAPSQWLDNAGVTHNVGYNAKLKKTVEFDQTTGEPKEIPGVPGNWEKYTPQTKTFTTPEDTIGVFSPAKVLRRTPAEGTETTPPAVQETNVKVAPPIGFPVQDPRAGTITGTLGRGGKYTPAPSNMPQVAKTPFSEARITKEDEIKTSLDNVGELEQLYPRVQNELKTITGKAKAIGLEVSHPLLIALAEKMGLQVSDDLKDFVNISNNMSAAEVRKRSGVAFKEWELKWIQKSLPTYSSTNFAGSLRRYKRGLQIMQENRGMKSEAELDKLVGAESAKQEQKIPRRWKKLPNGKIAVENGPDDWDIAEPGFVADKKYEMP